MDPFNIAMLSNQKKCSTKITTDKSTESYNEIISLMKNIDNPDITKHLCKYILERHCGKQLTPIQLDIIFNSIRNIR
jgi:hypothetical protein